MDRKHGGDDLEDDFIPDDLVAFDEGEDVDGVQFDISDDTFPVANDEEGLDETGVKRPETAGTDKKRKRREKEKQKRSKKKSKLADELGAASDGHKGLSIVAQSPRMLANYLASMQAKAYPTLSDLELEDMLIPDTAIVDTTIWTHPRTLETLIDFITEVVPSLKTRLSQRSKSFGAPTLLFIAGAALRVADVTRVFKDKKLRGEKGGEAAKLFAKHFKLEEHVTYLKKTRVAVAVGTPGRIGKLLCDTDAFVLSALTHIIFDVSLRDVKDRSLLDIPENRDEVFRNVLGCPRIREVVRTGQVKIVLF